MNDLNWREKAGFGLVLLVTLALSFWSLAHLAETYFHIPALLAIFVSIGFDGAGLFTAGLASKYSRSAYSGMAARLATVIFLAVSAYLNVVHADLLGLGIEGMVFLGSPPIIAAILFELYLKYEHRRTLKRQGRVAPPAPVFGKMSWLIFPMKTSKAFKRVLEWRLNGVVESLTGQMTQEPSKTAMATVTEDSDQRDSSSDSDTMKIKSERVTKPKAKTVAYPEILPGEYPDVQQDMTISQLVPFFWHKGITDRDELQHRISEVKGEEVSRNTINKNISRAGLVNGRAH
jgi:hypothetical protein